MAAQDYLEMPKDPSALILDFLKVSANLKNVRRQGWVDKLNHKCPETVAEHVYSMAMIGMILSDFEGRDTEKILKMILLHDMAESIIGDITPDQMSKKSKEELEDKAMRQILDRLPDRISGRYMQLWDEFQHMLSEESKLVHQIDKLEMALQAKIYSDDGYAPQLLTPFFDSAKDEITEKNIKEIIAKIRAG